MTTTYRLDVNELSAEILDSIKAAFKNKTVEITVTDAVDEADYLLAHEANRKHLIKSMEELENGKGVEMTVQEFSVRYGGKS